MPKFFVCTAAQMGGISIVFVAGSAQHCADWIDQQLAAGDAREFFIYSQMVLP